MAFCREGFRESADTDNRPTEVKLAEVRDANLTKLLGLPRETARSVISAWIRGAFGQGRRIPPGFSPAVPLLCQPGSSPATSAVTGGSAVVGTLLLGKSASDRLYSDNCVGSLIHKNSICMRLRRASYSNPGAACFTPTQLGCCLVSGK